MFRLRKEKSFPRKKCGWSDLHRYFERLDEFQPYRLDTPVRLDLTFKSYMPAEVLSYLAVVERVDAHTIRFVGEDMVGISRFLQFVGTYSSSLTP